MEKSAHTALNRILLASYNISLFSEGIILPIYAIFVQRIGGSILDAGIAMGIFLISEGIFTIFVHRMKHAYWQRIRAMVLGWFIWLLGILMYLIISNKWTLFAAQVMLALGNAIADPIYDEEYAENTRKRSAEREWGNFEGSKSFVDGIAAILGGIIASLFGFDVLVYVMALTGTVSFLLVLYYVRRLKKTRNTADSST